MSLLREIQENTCASNVELSNVLRKCKILAARLNYKPLQEWVERELSGYSEKDDLPQYRIFHDIELSGNFFTPTCWGKNFGVPSLLIPDPYRNQLTTIYWKENIGVIESFIRKAEGNTIRMAIPQDIFIFLKSKVEDLDFFTSLHRVISVHQLTFIIDEVKNRIINFAIEIEKTNPEAGEATFGTPPIPEPVVSQIFYRCILQDYSIGENVKISANLSDIQSKSETNIMSEVRQSKYDLSQASVGNVVDQAQEGSNVRGIGSQHNYAPEQRQNLAEAAAEIQQLLKQLEEINPIATDAEKIEHINDETTPKFKRRVVGALQATGEAAIDEFVLENKYLKVAKAAIKGWMKPE